MPSCSPPEDESGNLDALPSTLDRDGGLFRVEEAELDAMIDAAIREERGANA